MNQSLLQQTVRSVLESLQATTYILSLAPSAAISATVVSAMPTSILIRWSVIESVQAPSGYNISYSNTENTDCFTISETVSITSDARNGSYNIERLQEGTEYSITVRLLRNGTISDMDTVQHSTADAGELLYGSIRSRFM